MKIGCGTSDRTSARGSRRSRPRGEEAAQPVDLPGVRLVVQIRLAAQFARQPLALRERRQGVVVAAHLVEQPALLQQFIGPEPAVVVRRVAVDQLPAPRRIAACGRAARRASAARPDRSGTAHPSCRASRRRRRNCRRPPPAAPSRAASGGCPARRRRIPRRARAPPSMRPWFFRFQARLASRIGSRCAGQFQHAAIVVFADLRPVAPRS